MVQQAEAGRVPQGEMRGPIWRFWVQLAERTYWLTCRVDSDLTGVEVTRGTSPEGGAQ